MRLNPGFHKRSFVLLTLVFLGQATLSLAYATISIPEALGTGKQLGANSEAQVSSNLGSMQGSVQNSTGVSGIQPTGNPADGVGSPAGATATGSYSFNLQCTDHNPIFPGGYGIQPYNCQYTGQGNQQSVSQLTLAYCLASITGGNCSPGSSNWHTTAIGANQSVQLSNTITVSLGTCPANGSGSCPGTLTVNANSVQPTDSGDLTNEATDQVVSGKNSLQNTLEKTYNSGNYQGAIQTGNQTFQLNSCTQQIKGGLEGNGIVYTCNGQQSADFGASCKTETQCVKFATQEQSYTTSCHENIPLTEQTCTTVTPTQQCTITEDTAQYTCYNTLTASVTASNSCTPGQWYTLGSSTQCGIGYCGDVMYGTAGGECYQYTLQVLCNPGSQTLQYQATSVYWGQGANGDLYANWSGYFSNGTSEDLTDPSMASNNCDGGWDWFPDIHIQANINSLGNVTGQISFNAWMGPAGYSPLVACNNPTPSTTGPDCLSLDGQAYCGNSAPNSLAENNCLSVSDDNGNSAEYCLSSTPNNTNEDCLITDGQEYCTYYEDYGGGLFDGDYCIDVSDDNGNSAEYCVPSDIYASTVFCNQIPGDGPSSCNYSGGNTINYYGATYTCSSIGSTGGTGDLVKTINLDFVQQTKTVQESWNNGCSIYANAS